MCGGHGPSEHAHGAYHAQHANEAYLLSARPYAPRFVERQWIATYDSGHIYQR